MDEEAAQRRKRLKRALVARSAQSRASSPNLGSYIAQSTGGGPVTDPGVASINAEGWSVQFNSPPTFDPVGSPQIVVASRQGFTTAGATTTYTESLILTKRVRQAYPNQGLLDANRCSMSDYIYSTDTCGVTNNSAETSPKPIANWALPDRTVVGNTLHLEIVAGHRDARNNEEVASVIFRATDGSLTVTQTVSASSKSTLSTDRHPLVVYQCDLDISTLATGLVTANAKVYPWIGGAASVNDSADQVNVREFSPRFYLHNAALAAAPPYAYVATTGNDGTGVVSTTLATAKATPFLTIIGAIAGLKLSKTILDGCQIIIGSGSFVAGAVPSGGAPQTNGEYIITRDPVVARASAIVTWGAAVFTTRSLWFKFKDVTLTRTGASQITFLSAAGQVVMEDVTFNNASNNQAFSGTTGAGVYVNGATISGVTTAPFGAGGGELRLFRGVLSSNQMAIEGWLILASALDTDASLTNAGATRTASGSIIAGNSFETLSPASDFYVLAGTQPVTGVAVLQNIWEWCSVTTNPMHKWCGDNALANLAHVVMHHNTTVGFFNNGRGNMFYDENTTARTNKLHSMKGNIHVSLNTKGDVFRGVNEAGADASTRVGNWAYLYGVGCAGEFSQFIDANSGGIGTSFAQAYQGLKAKIGTSNSVRQDPLFTNYQATTSGPTAGAGSGTYSITTGSPCEAMLTTPVLKFDFAGNARPSTNDAAGAFKAA